MRILLAIIVVFALAGAGCRHKRAAALAPGVTPAPRPAFNTNSFSSSPSLIVTPDSGLAGKVVRVNNQGRFVVLSFPISHLPALDQALNVYRLGLKVGEVRVTGPQYDDNIVGDLVAGEAQPGDLVRDR